MNEEYDVERADVDRTGRRYVRCIVIICCSLAVSCAATSRVLTRTTRTYSHLGGAALGSPNHLDGRIHIPVTLGKDGFAFMGESATWIQKIDVSRTGTQIRFSVVTALEEPRKPVNHEIVVEDLEPGTYSVVYEDPDGTLHSVGEFTIDR